MYLSAMLVDTLHQQQLGSEICCVFHHKKRLEVRWNILVDLLFLLILFYFANFLLLLSLHSSSSIGFILLLPANLQLEGSDIILW